MWWALEGPSSKTATALIVVYCEDYQSIARERSVFAHSYHMLLSEVRVPVLHMGSKCDLTTHCGNA